MDGSHSFICMLICDNMRRVCNMQFILLEGSSHSQYVIDAHRWHMEIGLFWGTMLAVWLNTVENGCQNVWAVLCNVHSVPGFLFCYQDFWRIYQEFVITHQLNHNVWSLKNSQKKSIPFMSQTFSGFHLTWRSTKETWL